MSDLSPFVVDKAIRSVLGKNYTSKISMLRSGLLLIEVDQVAEYNKLVSRNKLGDIPVKISLHKQLNTSKGTIYCDNDAVNSMTNEQIQAELSAQDVEDVYRVTKRDGTKTNVYILTFKNSKLPSEIKIGYIKTNVKLYIPNPRRCFNCQRYGHGKTTCTHETVCVTCGQKGHEYGSEHCDQEPHCYHCGDDHPSSFRSCPMWQLEKKIITDKLTYNLTFRDARTRVYRSHPQLTSRIPAIKIPNQQSYSTISAQPSNTTKLQQQIQKQSEQIQKLTETVNNLLTVIAQQRSLVTLNENHQNRQSEQARASTKRTKDDSSSEDESEKSSPPKRGVSSVGPEDKNLPNPSQEPLPESEGESVAMEQDLPSPVQQSPPLKPPKPTSSARSSSPNYGRTSGSGGGNTASGGHSPGRAAGPSGGSATHGRSSGGSGGRPSGGGHTGNNKPREKITAPSKGKHKPFK